MSEPTNEARAAWAGNAINTHSRATHIQGEEEEIQLTDLLCNLMHWADDRELDFHTILLRAMGHHQAESEDTW